LGYRAGDRRVLTSPGGPYPADPIFRLSLRAMGWFLRDGEGGVVGFIFAKVD